MPLDLSKLSDDELKIYEDLVSQKTKEAYFQTPALPGPKVPEGLKPGGVDRTPVMTMDNLGDLKDRAIGAGLGGLFGGPVGAGIGAVVPPRTPGDIASQVVGGGIGSKLGPMVSKLSGLRGVLGAAGAGAAENLAMQGTRAAAGEKTDDLGTSTAMAAGVPLLAKGLFQSPAKNSPYGKARDFLAKLTGSPLEPSDVPTMRSSTSTVNPKNNLLSPAGRVFAQTTNNIATKQAEQKTILDTAKAEAQRLKNAKADFAAQEVKLKGLIDSAKRTNKRGLGKMTQQFDDMEAEYTAPALEKAMDEFLAGTTGQTNEVADLAREGYGNAIKDRVKILAARKQIAAAKSGQLKMPAGPLDAPVQNSRVETLINNLQQTKMAKLQAAKDYDNFAKVELPKIQEAIRSSREVDPQLLPFSKTSTPSEFLDTLVKTKHENVTALRNQLSPAGQKALEKTFETEFARMAVGPDGSLSNIEQASKAFPFDKVAAIYGGGAKGEEKAQLAARATADMMRMLQESKTSPLKKMSTYTIGTIPTYMLFKLGSSPSIEKAVTTGAAIAGSVAAVQYPKLINKVVSDKQFGEQFHQWATQSSVSDSLANYPLVERFFHENADKVKEVKEKAKNSLP